MEDERDVFERAGRTFEEAFEDVLNKMVYPRFREKLRESERMQRTVFGFQYYRKRLVQCSRTVRVSPSEPEAASWGDAFSSELLNALSEERLLTLVFIGEGAVEARHKLMVCLKKIKEDHDAAAREKVDYFRDLILKSPKLLALAKESVGELLGDAFTEIQTEADLATKGNRTMLH